VSNSQARVEEIFVEAARLFAEKNRHYGDSWRNQGWRGNISRMLEKAGRIRKMVWRSGDVLLNGGSEHPRETLLDMLNTVAFAIINIDDRVEWGTEPGAQDIPAPLPAVPGWARGGGAHSAMQELPPREAELEYFRASYGNPALTLEDVERLKAAHSDEQTTVQPAIGDVPAPGEEPSNKPSPHKRGQGSGSRPVTDRS
jgi:hypothetical protein